MVEPTLPAGPVKWAAQLTHVREVSLLGSADLNFWTGQLLSANLHPAESDGQAKILIVAADAKYFGLRFRELSISVLVRQPSEEGRDAPYLLRAYNSRRLFAL